LTWIDPTVALPGAGDAPNVWPVLQWMFARGPNLLAWDGLAPDVEWARTLPGHADNPYFHLLDAVLLQGVVADLAAAAAAFARAADGFAAEGDLYQAVRCWALNLYCRAPAGIDKTFDADVERVAAQARSVGSPVVRAYGVVAFVAAAPAVVIADPARALRLLDEAAPHAARSRNPFVARILSGGRALALALLGDTEALGAASEQIVVTRNRNQVGVQAGALSVAFNLMGHHQYAAELIGATRAMNTMYNGLRSSAVVVDTWERTRAALGDEEYEAAIARGAARDYDDTVDWLRHVLEDLGRSNLGPSGQSQQPDSP